MMRLAYFPVIDKSQALLVGIMCASPGDDTQGFEIDFEGFNVTEDEKKQ